MRFGIPLSWLAHYADKIGREERLPAKKAKAEARRRLLADWRTTTQEVA